MPYIPPYLYLLYVVIKLWSVTGGGFADLSDMGAGDALTLGLGQSEYDRRKKKK